MFICYLDESGTPESTGTGHFVLVGLAIPVPEWKAIEQAINALKRTYGLGGEEVHTAWLARRYAQQEKIPDFDQMSFAQRRSAVEHGREQHLIRLAATGTRKQLESAKKNYRKSSAYVHLNWDERRRLLSQLADMIGQQEEITLFAEAIDKEFVYSGTHRRPPYEFAFTELIQRFEYFLRDRSEMQESPAFGLLVQDNNETVARRLTELMRRFHSEGTRWTEIEHIVETPMFVDSQLTTMVQLADLCGYAVRRFFEVDEAELFDRVSPRIHRRDGKIVGARHFAPPDCPCVICADRNR